MLRESQTATRYIVVVYEIKLRPPETLPPAHGGEPPQAQHHVNGNRSSQAQRHANGAQAPGAQQQVSGTAIAPSANGAQNGGASHHDVFIRTFGYFDVFVDGVSVVFSSAKAKELLALLVDRRGGAVSAADAVACLWENEAATPTVLSRQRKVALRMKNTLEEYGIGHIVITQRGKRSLDTRTVRCDLYEYLAGNPDVAFTGAYLQNYSWGELTLGELTHRAG